MSLLESVDPAVQNNPEARSGVSPETGPRAEAAGGAELSWLERALDDMLALRRQDPPRWIAQARRLLGLTEVDDVLSRIETGDRPDMMAAVAEAMDIRFDFNGLENLAGIGDRPVIVFGNHPIGSGNVLGMSLLLTQRFPDHRIIGHRYMKFIRAFAEKMIPVDPFHPTSAINLESLVKLRREFGTQYQALGLFPAGNSSQLKWPGGISDRPWFDAFIRIARHHDALLVPLWFSGRNRLRYYVASKIRAELGFLALPAEFLRLRGKSITVNIGRPIPPDLMRAIPSRRAQLSFLRAGVYELERERATPLVAANKAVKARTHVGAKQAPIDPVPVGENVELRFFDGAAAARIEELPRSAGPEGLDGATTHVVLTPRDRLMPFAHWQMLDWGQFAPAELDRLSPLRQAFRLPDDVAGKASNWLEIVGFAAVGPREGAATLRQIRMGLRLSAVASIRATDLVGIVTPQETSYVLAALQFAVLQKARGDATLLRAGAAHDLVGATQHHDWRPHRDVVIGDRSPGRRRIRLVDPVLRAVSALGLRFGAAGLSAEPARRPCILGRLTLAR